MEKIDVYRGAQQRGASPVKAVDLDKDTLYIKQRNTENLLTSKRSVKSIAAGQGGIPKKS